MLRNRITPTVGNFRQAAMTAVELLIIVAVIGLLLLVTVPGSSMLIERYRLNSASNDLARGLTLARCEPDHLTAAAGQDDVAAEFVLKLGVEACDQFAQ